MNAFWDSDLFYSFRRSKLAMVSFGVALVCVLGAVLAPLLAPHDPTDLASLSLMDSLRPPAFMEEGGWEFQIGRASCRERV